AVHQVHGIDDQRDVRRVLARDIGELLVRDDGVLGEDVGPAAQAGAREVAVDAPDAGLAQLRDFLEHTVGDFGRGVVGVDQDGQTWRAGFEGHSVSPESIARPAYAGAVTSRYRSVPKPWRMPPCRDVTAGTSLL